MAPRHFFWAIFLVQRRWGRPRDTLESEPSSFDTCCLVFGLKAGFFRPKSLRSREGKNDNVSGKLTVVLTLLRNNEEALGPAETPRSGPSSSDPASSVPNEALPEGLARHFFPLRSSPISHLFSFLPCCHIQVGGSQGQLAASVLRQS